MEQGHRKGEVLTMCPWLGLWHPLLKFFPPLPLYPPTRPSPPSLTTIVDTLIPLTSDFTLLPMNQHGCLHPS